MSTSSAASISATTVACQGVGGTAEVGDPVAPVRIGADVQAGEAHVEVRPRPHELVGAPTGDELEEIAGAHGARDHVGPSSCHRDMIRSKIRSVRRR